MINKLRRAKAILKKYNQEHLLRFYKELTKEQRKILIDQILNIDFGEIIGLYEHSKKTINDKDTAIISPLNHYEKNLIDAKEMQGFISIGEDTIKSQKFAVVTMAGGQGTRLGYKGPKGTYELKFEETNKKKSLFQIMCEDLKRANKKYNITIPWYIMTSEENDKKTKEYFEENNYWNYPKENLKFFIQGKLPLIDVDGKLILQETYLIKTASNGNGNVFNSMSKHNIIKDMQSKGIQWVSFGGIDNVLLKNADPLFLGLTIAKDQKIASKSIFKQDPLEKNAVFCKKDGKPAILDYDEIDLELSNSKFDNGMYKYRDSNIISHLMSIDAIIKIKDVKLPYHRSYKKNAFVNEEGMKQVPDSPNTFKYENFIFDGFKYFDDMLLLRVNPNEEFAPIKDFRSEFNPDTAKEKYEHYWKNHKF